MLERQRKTFEKIARSCGNVRIFVCYLYRRTEAMRAPGKLHAIIIHFYNFYLEMCRIVQRRPVMFQRRVSENRHRADTRQADRPG